jgi:hypothetical protein
MMPSSNQVGEVLARVEGATGADNALDIAIDIALFRPDSRHVSVRANSAGTKLVYTRHDGGTDTFWARDHTLDAVGRDLPIVHKPSCSSQEL